MEQFRSDPFLSRVEFYYDTKYADVDAIDIKDVNFVFRYCEFI